MPVQTNWKLSLLLNDIRYSPSIQLNNNFKMESIKKKIKVLKGDITKIKADAIVNAANSSLMGGSGVDEAIHKAGGISILKECKLIISETGKCETGKAVITTAGKLPAKFVIHTVGPVWKGGNSKEKKMLAECYKNSLQLAVENGCRTIAFPNISTGVYRFPKNEAAEIAVDAVSQFLTEEKEVDEVIFVCFDDDNFELIKKQL